MIKTPAIIILFKKSNIKAILWTIKKKIDNRKGFGIKELNRPSQT